MYSFDGEFKRKREQDLSGASKISAGKIELISRAQKQRMKRMADKKMETSAVRIQKMVRGYLSRRKENEGAALELKYWLYRRVDIKADPADFNYIMPRLRVIPRRSLTTNHVAMVTNRALTINNELLNLTTVDSVWVFRLKTFLTLVIGTIDLDNTHSNPIDEKTTLMAKALCTFTDVDNNNLALKTTLKKLILHLLRNNYMEIMRTLLLRIDSLQQSHDTSPHTSDDGEIDDLLDCVVKLFLRPLTMLDESDDPVFRNTVLDTLCSAITREECMSNIICEHVLPFMVCRIGNFPIVAAAERFLNFPEEMHVLSALYFFLYLDKNQTAVSKEDQQMYFKLLSRLTQSLICVETPKSNFKLPEGQTILTPPRHKSLKELHADNLRLLNTATRSEVWMNVLKEAIKERDFEIILYHATCIFHMIICEYPPPFTFRIISELWFVDGWLRTLWVTIESQVRMEGSESVGVLGLLKQGARLSKEEAMTMLPILSVFCSFLFSSLAFLTDEDLMKPGVITEKAVKPFTVNELMYIASLLKDVVVGLISIGYPENNMDFEEWYYYNVPTNNVKFNNIAWTQAMMECTKVVRELYNRNERCQVVDRSNWVNQTLAVADNRLHLASLHEVFGVITPFYPNRGLRSPMWHDKITTVLLYLPFTFCFARRYRILWDRINCEKELFQRSAFTLMSMSQQACVIRRNYLYEDAFNKLSLENEPQLKLTIKIRFRNSLNVDEAGIDGGGLFREFMTEFIKTAFDPNRGFFILTKDNKLYPNPYVATVYPKFRTHYFFIGRMLAKAIYENIAVDLPLADFFLAKILEPTVLYPSLLHTLDKELFRSISFLRTTNDFSTLGLDFTSTTNSFGSKKIIELKPGGSNIPLSSENVPEYLHLLSEQKLHLDISKQTRAFAKGLGNLLPLQLLRMFTINELQLIISGGDTRINVEDMKLHVSYSGGYTPNHANIDLFWRVFESFNNQEQSQLLKFVTSCSRPPLLGFKELRPPLCIQLVEGVDNRLPSSSTCLNTLKLPIYSDENTMRVKLLYAIQSTSGFDLS